MSIEARLIESAVNWHYPSDGPVEEKTSNSWLAHTICEDINTWHARRCSSINVVLGHSIRGQVAGVPFE